MYPQAARPSRSVYLSSDLGKRALSGSAIDICHVAPLKCVSYEVADNLDEAVLPGDEARQICWAGINLEVIIVRAGFKPI